MPYNIIIISVFNEITQNDESYQRYLSDILVLKCIFALECFSLYLINNL